jgi:hypothetical protein
MSAVRTVSVSEALSGDGLLTCRLSRAYRGSFSVSYSKRLARMCARVVFRAAQSMPCASYRSPWRSSLETEGGTWTSSSPGTAGFAGVR